MAVSTLEPLYAPKEPPALREWRCAGCASLGHPPKLLLRYLPVPGLVLAIKCSKCGTMNTLAGSVLD